MIWIDHSRDFAANGHAMFSPSQSTWLNDESEEDIFRRYRGWVAADVGTLVHALASRLIKAKVRYTKKEAAKRITEELVCADISRSSFDPDFMAATVVSFVNDALGYGMRSEQKLVYSEECYGTADAIIFDEAKKILRIHDLKTGVTPAKFEQLRVYAALFYLEYGSMLGATPNNSQIELRIYQAGEVREEFPLAEDILPVMDSIVWHTKVARNIKKG